VATFQPPRRTPSAALPVRMMQKVHSFCCVGNKRLQLVKNFKHLTCKISYGKEKEKDNQEKVPKFAQILAIRTS
jgi:hypothetical protein